MTRRRGPAGGDPSPEPAADDGLETPLATADASRDDGDRHVIDLVGDELALARAQLDAGQAGIAEGTVRRRLAWLEAEGAGVGDEADALRALLAESLWRQGRPVAARAAIDAIRPSSPQRRLPRTMIVEAEALAAAGERDRSAGVVERVVAAIGVDEAWQVRGGVRGGATWPLPDALRPPDPAPPHPPWSTEPRPVAAAAEPPDDERIAAGRARLEEARVLYIAGDRGRGDAELSIALRLDARLAADGVAILEPTLGGQPSRERLLLYGDLLRAAGRDVEANEAYDRAAGQGS